MFFNAPGARQMPLGAINVYLFKTHRRICLDKVCLAKMNSPLFGIAIREDEGSGGELKTSIKVTNLICSVWLSLEPLWENISGQPEEPQSLSH